MNINKCDCGSRVPSEFYQIERNVTAINNNPPYPDPSGSGYWMIYDPTKRKYELSDVPVPAVSGSIDIAAIDGGDSKDFATGLSNRILTTHMQMRSDAEDNWKANDPLLMIGELGLTTDGANKGRFKIGDGMTAWSGLDYYGGTTPSGDQYVTIDMLENGDVSLPIAKGNQSGGIVSSSNENSIYVNSETGEATVASLSINKLSQEDGSVLVLDGGDADSLLV
jgi:hypothetical protein